MLIEFCRNSSRHNGKQIPTRLKTYITVYRLKDCIHLIALNTRFERLGKNSKNKVSRVNAEIASIELTKPRLLNFNFLHPFSF